MPVSDFYLYYVYIIIHLCLVFVNMFGVVSIATYEHYYKCNILDRRNEFNEQWNTTPGKTVTDETMRYQHYQQN